MVFFGSKKGGKEEEKKVEEKEEAEGNIRNVQESEDVPDELPDLAEDLLEKGEQEEKGGREATKQKDEPPERIPSISELSEEEQAYRAAEETSPQPVEVEVQREEKSGAERGSEGGYFADIISKLNPDAKLPEDLLESMKSFWKSKGILSQELKAETEEKLLSEIKRTVDKLSKLEKEWKNYSLTLDKTKQLLENTELEIVLASKELKKLLFRLRNIQRIHELLKKEVKGQEGIVKKESEGVKVPPEKYFYLCNGGVIRNLEELREAINGMSQDVFSFHVNETKNDFANWINDVLLDKELAEKFKGVHSLEEARKLINSL